MHRCVEMTISPSYGSERWLVSFRVALAGDLRLSSTHPPSPEVERGPRQRAGGTEAGAAARARA